MSEEYRQAMKATMLRHAAEALADGRREAESLIKAAGAFTDEEVFGPYMKALSATIELEKALCTASRGMARGVSPTVSDASEFIGYSDGSVEALARVMTDWGYDPDMSEKAAELAVALEDRRTLVLELRPYTTLGDIDDVTDLAEEAGDDVRLDLERMVIEVDLDPDTAEADAERILDKAEEYCIFGKLKEEEE